MTKNQEIRECYSRMGVDLAEQGGFGDRRWFANSQYGINLPRGPFATQRKAEAAALAYYRDRMHLIRQ